VTFDNSAANHLMALQTPGSKAKTAAPPAAAKTRGRPPATAAAKKAAPKVSAPKPVATVTLKGIFEELAAEQEMPKKHALAMAAGMVDRVTAILKNGDRVRINGLGTIEVRNRAARMGRNPATGATIQIAASKKIGFRAAKELKAAI
jgi:DNA-binding protein HU-beta